MTDHNLVEIAFTESSKAYEALSNLRRAGAEGRILVEAATIIEREPDGRLVVAESQDGRIGDATATGALTGLLIGVLGGPLGLVVGWGAGFVGGAYVDDKRAAHGETILGTLSRELAPGVTAIIAEVNEYTPEVLDAIMIPLGGVVIRQDAEVVLGQLEAAEDAAKAAEKEANRVLREEKREAFKKDWAERIDGLKARFQTN